MDTVEQCLITHWRTHPKLEVQDAVKFLFQSYMGNGHMIKHPAQSMQLLEDEWAKTAQNRSATLLTPLGNGLLRVHLAPAKGLGLSLERIHALSIRTAQTVIPDPDGLARSFHLLCKLPFHSDAVEQYLADYRRAGFPAVSHSETFRKHYAPAYRLVSADEWCTAKKR